MTFRALLLLLASAISLAAADLKNPASLTQQAPATYLARFDTSKGVFVVEVTREWAPQAADRFYNLVKHGFYDGARFFRVLDGFMAQFGLNGTPEIQRPWQSAGLPDEPVTQSNLRGFVSFAKESMPNTRFTMVFINFADNSFLDKDGFSPFGRVVSAMDVVDKLYSGYGRQNQPDQRRILREGNSYLQADYPRLDFIRKAALVTETGDRQPTARITPAPARP
jgi:peptidyl-prolyl cis-trans isomerase A (cyclophilin A)